MRALRPLIELSGILNARAIAVIGAKSKYTLSNATYIARPRDISYRDKEMKIITSSPNMIHLVISSVWENIYLEITGAYRCSFEMRTT